MLIGLTGYARAGKDTAALGCAVSFKRMAFATALKKDVENMLKASGIDPYADFSLEDCKIKYRPLLVAWGQIKRAEDPDYWIKKIKITPSIASVENIIITDVRYANEIEWIKEMGGKVILIARPEIGPANDEERKSFAEINDRCLKMIDKTLVNNSSRKDIGLQLKEYVENELMPNV